MTYKIKKLPGKFGRASVIKMELLQLNHDLLEVLQILHNESLHEKLREFRSLQELIEDFNKALSFLNKEITSYRYKATILLSNYQTLEIELLEADEHLHIIENFKNKGSLGYDKLREVSELGKKRLFKLFELISEMSSELGQKPIGLKYHRFERR